MEPKINLLPPEKKEARFESNRLLFILLVVCVLFFLAFNYLYSSFWIKTLQTKVATVNEVVVRESKLRGEYKQLQVAQKELEKKLSQIESFGEDVIWYDLLYELGELTPEDTYLSSFNINDAGEFSIQGGSLDYSLLAKMLNDLDSSSFFQNISLQRTTTNQVQDLKYVVFVVQGQLEGSSD